MSITDTLLDFLTGRIPDADPEDHDLARRAYADFIDVQLAGFRVPDGAALRAKLYVADDNNPGSKVPAELPVIMGVETRLAAALSDGLASRTYWIVRDRFNRIASTQAAAESAVRSGVAGARGQGVQQAALVAIDGEGRIRAYVGGADYNESQFDRATSARRQAGSAFKPFVYLAAMEAGRTPAVVVVDEPVRIGGWEPRNYTGKYLGSITLQTALAQSVNTVAARLANEVGAGNVAAVARRLGITSKIQLAPSMALGAVEVNPLEMAQSYAAFSNGGFFAKGYGIQRIRTATGRVLYDRNLEKRPRRSVIGSPSLQYMNQMMRE
eukprot:gene41028-55452_t